VKLIKKVGHVFCQIFNKTFSVGLTAKIDNPVPAIQVRFQQFRVTERFCVATSAVIVGHSGTNLEFFIDCTFRASVSLSSALRKLINPVPLFPLNSGRGASQGD